MRSILRNITINAFSLFLVSQILSGVKIEGGISTFIISGFVLYLMEFFLRPVLTLITLPFNMATFGIFSFLINVIVFYLLTLFIPQVKISPFNTQGVSFAGFVIPNLIFNQFFAYIAASIVLSFIMFMIKWLIDR